MNFLLDTNKLSPHQLNKMKQAGVEIRHCYGLMKKSRTNIIARVIAGHDTFYEFDHYPKGDVYDIDTHAQYYYHAHREEAGEHGHFHTFLRAKGFPDGITEAPYNGSGERPLGDDALSHIIAISMDHEGFPIALFTTNRWVTDETYYVADDVIRMIDHFDLEMVHPCLSVNRWISAMLVLFRPQINALLKERDARLYAWQARHKGVDVFEDRDLEITSILDIDVDAQMRDVEAALDS